MVRRRLAVALLVGLRAGAARAGDDAPPPCARVAIWRDGNPRDVACAADAARAGLAIVDLGDAWTPPVFAAGADYAPRFRDLAAERFGAADELARADRYFELYGIPPAPSVVLGRLADDARHACHAAVADAPLLDPRAPAEIREDTPAAELARLAAAHDLRAALDHDRARRKVADLDALAAAEPWAARALARLRTAEARRDAIAAAQAHLACDRLAPYRPIAGAYTWHTANGVGAFQRGAMILPTAILDEPTRAMLALDSRERDYRTALRVLRERVVAATGLVEDGTASAGEVPVFGRPLEPTGTWRAVGLAAGDGAPDLVDAATEEAARQLGWIDASATRVSLATIAEAGLPVAIALPPPPAYHAPAMELRVAIDRGGDGARPTLEVSTVTAGGDRLALVRWPTTVGGWQDEVVAGALVRRWKASPLGPRVWRDLVVGPVWLPPRTTPDRELVRRDESERFVLAREAIGPSYRGAFGLVAFVHQTPAGDDEGIRTHGTGNLASLASGASHGCHRILGRNAIRLADFVLAHHPAIARGERPTWYRRIVAYGGWFAVALDKLGFVFELVPPIRVDVR